MTRQIPKQYWKFYTPEQLAWRDDQIASETAHKSSEPYAYLRYLRGIALQRYGEFTIANREFQEVTNTILTEASATCLAGGLELLLRFDENGELPYDRLLPYASLPTQQRYAETREKAAQLLAISQILVNDHNKMRELYAEAGRKVDDIRKNSLLKEQVPLC